MACWGRPPLYHTVDGGTTWKKFEIKGRVSDDYADFAFPTSTSGWVAGSTGPEKAAPWTHSPLLLHGSDGFRTWRPERVETPDQRVGIQRVVATDEHHAWAIGWDIGLREPLILDLKDYEKREIHHSPSPSTSQANKPRYFLLKYIEK